MEEVQDTRFWAKVSKGDGCWLWEGSRNRDGYGMLGRGGESLRAHRYAWELATGERLESSDVIGHTCDTTNCVRNDDVGTYRVGHNVYPRRGHLYKATQPANVADRDAKKRGRWATGEEHGTHRHPETRRRGERHAHAKLTDADVAAIKASYTGAYGQKSALARRFGVSAPVIAGIVNGAGWAHVAATGQAIDPATLRRSWEHGERHSQAKLTEAQVRAMRDAYDSGKATQADLMRQYGVSRPCICLIVNRKSWTHIP